MTHVLLKFHPAIVNLINILKQLAYCIAQFLSEGNVMDLMLN